MLTYKMNVPEVSETSVATTAGGVSVKETCMRVLDTLASCNYFADRILENIGIDGMNNDPVEIKNLLSQMDALYVGAVSVNTKLKYIADALFGAGCEDEPCKCR